MTFKNFIEIPDLPAVQLRDITKEDAMELARIDAAGLILISIKWSTDF